MSVSSTFAVRNLVRMNDTKRDLKNWVRALADHTGLAPSALAKRAGMSGSTVTRFLASDDDSMLSTDKIAMLAKLAGVKPLEFPNRRGAFSDADAEPYEAPDVLNAIDGSVRAIRELCAGRNGRDAWRMKSAVLDMTGIMPGDVIIVDLNKKPKSGDLVCAQVYDWRADRADTIMRMYDAPFLVSQSHTMPSTKPLMVDDDTVMIKGVIDAVLRIRQ